MRPDPILLNLLAELLVNLSAGFYGAAFIVPLQRKRPTKLNLKLLTVNVSLGTLILALAYLLQVPR